MKLCVQHAIKNFKKLILLKVYIEGQYKCDFQLWVSLLEKAIAKAYGTYGNLVTGSSKEGLEILTGFYLFP